MFEASASKDHHVKSLYSEFVYKFSFYKDEVAYAFYKNGKIHNENGPDIIHYDGDFEYYYGGKRIFGSKYGDEK